MKNSNVFRLVNPISNVLIDALASIASLPEVVTPLGWTDQKMQEWSIRDGRLFAAVSGKEVVGAGCLHGNQLAFFIHPSYWSNGYGPRLASRLTETATIAFDRPFMYAFVPQETTT